MTLDPWLMILVGVVVVVIVVRLFIHLDQSSARRDARRRNQARPRR